MQFDHPQYLLDLKQVIRYIVPWTDASVLITGATGLIGSFLVDAFLLYNQQSDKKIEITATSRHMNKLYDCFGDSAESEYLHLLACDSCEPIAPDAQYDYIIHLASNADPRSYALYPAETIITNVQGTLNVLEYARIHKNARVLFASTFEVYGNVPKTRYIYEKDYGSIDFNEVRSGYPESKRTAELMIRSFTEEYNVNAVIARLCSVYGPTMTKTDNKAAAQFIKKAVAGEDIVLKSKGEQRRSYCYVADAAAGILVALYHGISGEAYNVCNPESELTIAELAHTASALAKKSVVYDVPDEIEKKGFSKPKDSVLSAEKLMSIGYVPCYSVEQGLKNTIDILSVKRQ